MGSFAENFFLAIDSDAERIASTLWYLYGISVEQKQPKNFAGTAKNGSSSVEAIFDRAIELCEKLRVDDKTFINGNKFDLRGGLLDFLAIDCFFHLRRIKETEEQQNQGNLTAFVEDVLGKKWDEPGMPDKSNYYKKFGNAMTQPCISEFGSCHKDRDFSVPKFMNRLLYKLVECNGFSPYTKRPRCGKNYPCTDKSLTDLFITLNKEVPNLYKADCGNSFIAEYITTRFYDWDTRLYLVQKLREYEATEGPKLHSDYIIQILSSLFFVPNPYVKRACCDLAFDVLKESSPCITQLDDRRDLDDNVLASFIDPQPPAQLAERNLIRCSHLFAFLSTVYYPVLQSCFYVLMTREFGDNAEAQLLNYIKAKAINLNPSNSPDDNEATYCWDFFYLSDINNAGGFEQLSKKDRQNFLYINNCISARLNKAEFMATLKDATTLDYTASSQYTDRLVKLIIKEKSLSTFPQNNDLFIE